MLAQPYFRDTCDRGHVLTRGNGIRAVGIVKPLPTAGACGFRPVRCSAVVAPAGAAPSEGQSIGLVMDAAGGLDQTLPGAAPLQRNNLGGDRDRSLLGCARPQVESNR